MGGFDGWLWLGSDRPGRVLQVLAAGFGGSASAELGKGLSANTNICFLPSILLLFSLFFAFKRAFSSVNPAVLPAWVLPGRSMDSDTF